MLLKQYIEAVHPGTPLNKVMELLGSEDRKGFECIRSDQWVPYELYTHVLEAISTATKTDPIQFGNDYGMFLVKHDLPMIIRMAIKFGGPGLVVMEADQVWKKYHDTGHMRPSNSCRGAPKPGWRVSMAAALSSARWCWDTSRAGCCWAGPRI